VEISKEDLQLRTQVDVRKLRQKRGVSQAKLAKLLGIRQYIVSSWERFEDSPTADQLSMIHEVLQKVDQAVGAGDLSLFRKKRRTDWAEIVSNVNDIDVQSYRASVHHDGSSPYRDYLDELSRLSKVAGDENPTAIALFAGCGGMSLGFKWAGFNLLGHVELDPAARETYHANFLGSRCLGTDIRDVSDEVVRGWREEFGTVSVLFGGPPCQGFSLAGKRDSDDPRNELYREFARVARTLRPEYVVLENVRLMTSMKSRSGDVMPSAIMDCFGESGYQLISKSLNARNYGVPQFRERVFFVGIRDDLGTKMDLSFPLETHGESEIESLFSPLIKPYLTFRNATSDLERLESGERSLSDPLHFAVEHPKHIILMLQNVPEGSSAHNNEDPNLRPSSGYNTTYKRLRWDEPSSTISTNFGMISGSRNVHPSCTRSLTIREAARCQSFPDDFKFAGRLGDIRRLIGNAVPPLLAKSIAEHIRTARLARCCEPRETCAS
jgi:DNA (cytosine-5)-methyltransferase 1